MPSPTRPLPPAHPHAARGNCSTPVNGKFCCENGQPIERQVRHFGRVTGDVLGSVLNIDARVVHTLLLVAICVAGFAHAANAPLPLKSGTYVVSSDKPCEDAAFADVIEFDVRSFHGPHEAQCQSTTLDQHGRSYRVSTTCRALGDGTAATPSTFVRRVRITSRSTFVLTRDKADDVYALCPEFH